VKPKLSSESDVRVHDINVRSAAINVFITGRLSEVGLGGFLVSADTSGVCEAGMFSAHARDGSFAENNLSDREVKVSAGFVSGVIDGISICYR
jgi:hypothetical protein